MPAPAALRVLIVDDYESHFSSFRRYFACMSSPPASIRTALNGQLALERIAEEVPDRLITDTNMPVMGGPALVRAARTKPQCADMRIILMSTDREFGRIAPEVGADAFLLKSTGIDEFLALIDEVFERPPVSHPLPPEMT